MVKSVPQLFVMVNLLETAFAKIFLVGSAQMSQLMQKCRVNLFVKLFARAHDAQKISPIQHDGARFGRLFPDGKSTKQPDQGGR